MAEERREAADVAEMEQMEGQEKPAKKKGKFKLILIVFRSYHRWRRRRYFMFGKKIVARYLGKQPGAVQAPV
jgi:hypothetical protein